MPMQTVLRTVRRPMHSQVPEKAASAPTGSVSGRAWRWARSSRSWVWVSMVLSFFLVVRRRGFRRSARMLGQPAPGVRVAEAQEEGQDSGRSVAPAGRDVSVLVGEDEVPVAAGALGEEQAAHPVRHGAVRGVAGRGAQVEQEVAVAGESVALRERGAGGPFGDG